MASSISERSTSVRKPGSWATRWAPFPIDWPEPFGLVMIEAMACGTPVLAFDCGAVPEVIDHGQTGFIVNSIDQALAMLAPLLALDRRRVRRRFEERFTADRMASDYARIYAQQIARRQPSRLARRTPLPVQERPASFASNATCANGATSVP